MTLAHGTSARNCMWVALLGEREGETARLWVCTSIHKRKMLVLHSAAAKLDPDLLQRPLSPERLHDLPQLGRGLRPLLVGRARDEQECQVALSARIRTHQLAGEPLSSAVSVMTAHKAHWAARQRKTSHSWSAEQVCPPGRHSMRGCAAREARRPKGAAVRGAAPWS